MVQVCSRHQGIDRGDWYAPDSEEGLPLFQSSDSSSAAVEVRGNQTVTLYQRRSIYITEDIQSGIYRCEIAVKRSGRGTVYIGLYDIGGI